MNDLVKADSSRQLAGVAVPTPSRWLADELRDARNPHADVGYRPASIRPGLAEEAKRHIVVLDRVLLIATAPDWERWLKPLAVLPNAPGGSDKFRLEVSAIAFANSDVPAAVLTVERQRDALRRFGFWPTPKDIGDLFRPFVREVQQERVALQRIVTAAEKTSRPQISDEERARVGNGLRDLRAELERRSEVVGSGPRKARPLFASEGSLLRKYEAMANAGGPGAEAAAMRASALREKLQGHAHDD